VFGGAHGKEHRMRKRSVGLVVGVLVGVGGVAGVAALGRAQPPERPREPERQREEGQESQIKLSDTPEAVRAAVTKLTTADQVKKVTRETDEGVTTFEVEYTTDGGDCSAVFSPAGDVLELEKPLKDALPGPAAEAINKRFKGAEIKGRTSVQKFSYEVQVVVDGKTREVRVDACGRFEDEEEHDKD
jgi:hypothetical protein